MEIPGSFAVRPAACRMGVSLYKFIILAVPFVDVSSLQYAEHFYFASIAQKKKVDRVF